MGFYRTPAGNPPPPTHTHPFTPPLQMQLNFYSFSLHVWFLFYSIIIKAWNLIFIRWFEMIYADLCLVLKTAGWVSTGTSSSTRFFIRGSIKSEVQITVLLYNCIFALPLLSASRQKQSSPIRAWTCSRFLAVGIEFGLGTFVWSFSWGFRQSAKRRSL